MKQFKVSHINSQALLLAAAFTSLVFAGCSASREADGHETTKKKTPVYRSNFDFVAGKKILWQETFASYNTGDFPKGWNTNAGAEVVEEDKSSKALLLTKDGVYIPTWVNLPKNFTLQFTLSCSRNYSYYSSPLQVMFASLSSKKEFTQLKQYNPHNKDLVKLTIHPANAASNAGASTIEQIVKGKKESENEIGTKEFFAGTGTATAKVSIWRQEGRLRVYLNEKKIWDLPQAFEENVSYNSLVFGISHLVDKTGRFYLSDIVLATDPPATETATKK